MSSLKKLAIGCVAYKPCQTLLGRLHEAQAMGLPVYIYDNSPEDSRIREFIRSKQSIKYFTAGKNVGLGIGISTVCAQAYYDNYSAMLFFDQDTIFSVDTLKAINKYYQENLHLSSKYSAVVFKSAENIYENNNYEPCFRDVTLAINSACLFFLDNLKRLNWHNENYFVDGVDYEFCLNSQVHGFNIGEYSCIPGLDHESEQGNRQYMILGTRYLLRIYSLSRVWNSTKSSLKLVFRSIYLRRFRFAAIITKLLCIYIASQLIARVLRYE